MNERRVHSLRQMSATWKQQRGCNSKTRYPSKKNAKAMAKKHRDVMNAYKCGLCHCWHIGHVSTRRIPRPVKTEEELLNAR